MDVLINILAMTVPFSVALLLASIGEMFNQRAGVFNLGCEGIMAIGAFVGMLIPFLVGRGGAVPLYYNFVGIILSYVPLGRRPTQRDPLPTRQIPRQRRMGACRDDAQHWNICTAMKTILQALM